MAHAPKEQAQRVPEPAGVRRVPDAPLDAMVPTYFAGGSGSGSCDKVRR